MPMLNRRTHLQEDIHFWVMRRLEQTPEISQRELARELGISLGGVNYCLQALIKKGWLKAGNFSRSGRKLSYAYLLTPAGIAEKSLLTKRFLKRKVEEYEALREEIEKLQLELPTGQALPDLTALGTSAPQAM
jgi:EPS-associated MarR family transcriptional regulator